MGISPLSIVLHLFIPVIWRLPIPRWLKVNIDGSCANACAGFPKFFALQRVVALSAFASNTKFVSLVAVEILAFIEVVSIAWVRDWNTFWIEADSMLVIHYFF